MTKTSIALLFFKTTMEERFLHSTENSEILHTNLINDHYIRFIHYRCPIYRINNIAPTKNKRHAIHSGKTYRIILPLYNNRIEVAALLLHAKEHQVLAIHPPDVKT